MRNASSTMLEKASVDDIQGFQAFTIRNLNKLSMDSDTEQYELFSVKEDPIDNRADSSTYSWAEVARIDVAAQL